MRHSLPAAYDATDPETGHKKSAVRTGFPILVALTTCKSFLGSDQTYTRPARILQWLFGAAFKEPKNAAPIDLHLCGNTMQASSRRGK